MSIEMWKRQKDESAKAYEAALIYFEMRAERSLENVAQKCIKSVSQIRRWSSQWNWVERAKAYDAHMHLIEQAAKEKALAEKTAIWEKRKEEIREQGWKAYEDLRAKAESMLRFPVHRTETQDGKTIVHPAKWTFQTAATVMKTAMDLGRMAAELASVYVEIDWDSLTREQLERIANGEPPASVASGNSPGTVTPFRRKAG
jgi:hypothetical protein